MTPIISPRISRPAARRRSARPRPARPVRHRRLSRPLSRADPSHAARRVGLHDRRRGGRARPLDVGRVPRAAQRGSHRRHPLRHEMVEARHDLGGRPRGHAARGVETSAEYVVAFCDGGYTTNLPLEDVVDGKAWVAFGYDGEPLDPEHGGPARLLVPHLYFWKSANGCAGSSSPRRTSRASGSRTATTCTATRGGNSGTGAIDLARRRGGRGRPGDAAGQDVRLDVPDWPGHLPGQHVDVRRPPRTATRRSAATRSRPRRARRGSS